MQVPKGTRVIDEDGNLICVFDRDLNEGDLIEVETFEWFIETPETFSEIHPSIIKVLHEYSNKMN